MLKRKEKIKHVITGLEPWSPASLVRVTYSNDMETCGKTECITSSIIQTIFIFENLLSKQCWIYREITGASILIQSSFLPYWIMLYANSKSFHADKKKKNTVIAGTELWSSGSLVRITDLNTIWRLRVEARA